MPNYKQQLLKPSLNIGGYVHPLKSTDKLKHLTITNSAAVPKTLKDGDTGSAYQIPTGKKLTIFFFNTMAGTGTDMDLCTTTAVDATTGKVILRPAAQMGGNDKIVIFKDLAAELYVTRDSAQATSSNTNLYAIEEDA